MKLDIGCGQNPKPDYIGIDAYVEGGGIVKAEMWNLPYADNEIERIYSSHALEHVSKAQVIPTLKEWHRVLRPGSEAEIRVPDLEWCCNAWLEHQSNDWYMDILFGNQNHEGEFHKTGFTVPIMISYLNSAGFNDYSSCEIFSHGVKTLLFIVKKSMKNEG